MLYKRVELKEGEPVQFLGAYVLKWKNGHADPEVGFIEATRKDMEKAIENGDYLE